MDFLVDLMILRVLAVQGRARIIYQHISQERLEVGEGFLTHLGWEAVILWT